MLTERQSLFQQVQLKLLEEQFQKCQRGVDRVFLHPQNGAGPEASHAPLSSSPPPFVFKGLIGGRHMTRPHTSLPPSRPSNPLSCNNTGPTRSQR